MVFWSSSFMLQLSLLLINLSNYSFQSWTYLLKCTSQLLLLLFWAIVESLSWQCLKMLGYTSMSVVLSSHLSFQKLTCAPLLGLKLTCWKNSVPSMLINFQRFTPYGALTTLMLQLSFPEAWFTRTIPPKAEDDGGTIKSDACQSTQCHVALILLHRKMFTT